ncbi:pilus assembly protein [Vibrio makurazakiensis]|uniref:TadE family protein n=1 Tax=Vibrio makurazakiensis TaxID=2910250 RepID=UPI003D10579C
MMKRQSGSQSLEFTMVLIPFLILILGFFELSRLLLVNIIFDSAVSAGVRDVRSLAGGLRSEQTFIKKIGQFPMLETDKLTVSPPLYGKTISDIANLASVSYADAKLGEYKITYEFSFVLLPGLSEKFTESVGNFTTLSRKVLVSYDNK